MMLALNMGTSSFYTYLFIGIVVLLDRQARAELRQPMPQAISNAAPAP
jgi:hypothetical protein